mmetsp:Transcript_35591/g.79069  ORF Transcript_35591/g.79069 Transcript_35591/m.79069 type:complete len:1002 (+) Transcript_35591:203-3208(+)
MPQLEKRPVRVVLVAGPSDGIGKTSVTCGLAHSLRTKGLSVAAFRVGPDVHPGPAASDPLLSAAGSTPLNLDSWLLGQENVLPHFLGCVGPHDVALLDAAQGLFDGPAEQYTTAYLAKQLHATILLVTDQCSSVAGVLALLHGYLRFDKQLRISGVICNKCAPGLNRDQLQAAVEAAGLDTCILGCIPKVDKSQSWPDIPVDAAAALVSSHVDIDALLRFAQPVQYSSATSLPRAPLLPGKQSPQSGRARVAVAADSAFHCAYQENSVALQQAGAEVVFFSPLNDSDLPVDTAALYLGSGPLETYMHQLSGNKPMLAAIRAFCQAGGPVYAEGSGLICLSQSMQGFDGSTAPMAGVLPVWCASRGQERTGYVELEVQHGCPFLPPATQLRGYLYSKVEVREELCPADPATNSERLRQTCPAPQQHPEPNSQDASAALKPAFSARMLGQSGSACSTAYTMQNVLASDVLLYFAACPALVDGFLAAAQKADVVKLGKCAAAAAHEALLEARAQGQALHMQMPCTAASMLAGAQKAAAVSMPHNSVSTSPMAGMSVVHMQQQHQHTSNTARFSMDAYAMGHMRTALSDADLSALAQQQQQQPNMQSCSVGGHFPAWSRRPGVGQPGPHHHSLSVMSESTCRGMQPLVQQQLQQTMSHALGVARQGGLSSSSSHRRRLMSMDDVRLLGSRQAADSGTGLSSGLLLASQSAYSTPGASVQYLADMKHSSGRPSTDIPQAPWPPSLGTTHTRLIGLSCPLRLKPRVSVTGSAVPTQQGGKDAPKPNHESSRPPSSYNSSNQLDKCHEEECEEASCTARPSMQCAPSLSFKAQQSSSGYSESQTMSRQSSSQQLQHASSGQMYDASNGKAGDGTMRASYAGSVADARMSLTREPSFNSMPYTTPAAGSQAMLHSLASSDGIVSLCTGAADALVAMGLQHRLVGVRDDWRGEPSCCSSKTVVCRSSAPVTLPSQQGPASLTVRQGQWTLDEEAQPCSRGGPAPHNNEHE